MKVAIREQWSFIEAAQAAFDTYIGSGVMAVGRRNVVLRAWGSVVGRERALIEFDAFVARCGSPKRAAEELHVSEATVQRLRTFYTTLPSRAAQHDALNFLTLKLGHFLGLEETRRYEFKEVKGQNPVRTIKDTIKKYAIGFLNSEGGSVLWGVRNEDRMVVGIRLTYGERDELRRLINAELSTIVPPPVEGQYQIHFIPICHDGGTVVEDLFVVEVAVSSTGSDRLCFSSTGETYVRRDGETKKLSGQEIQQWLLHRWGSQAAGVRDRDSLPSSARPVQLPLLNEPN